MSNYYHVAEKWDGEAIESLFDRFGNDAEQMFIERWPDCGELSQDHPYVIHLHDNLSDAEEYVEYLKSEGAQTAQILKIDGTNLDIEEDNYEVALPHPVCKESIPTQLITAL